MIYQASTRLSITLPPELLKQMDALAKQYYISRSDLVRQAFLEWAERHGTSALAQLPSQLPAHSRSTLPADKPAPEPPAVPLHPTTKQPLPRYGTVAYKDLIEPGMTGDELLQLLFDYENNI